MRMSARGLVGALIIAVAAAWPAAAENDKSSARKSADVPTVTIINKAPEVAVAEEEAIPPALVETVPKVTSGDDAKSAAGLKSRGEPAGEEVSSEPAAVAETPPPPPSPTLAINIDLTQQVMTVSDRGDVLYTWPISSARYGYTTPTGTFQPTWMAKMWHSRQYDWSPMPYSIFFHKGVAIHGSNALRQLGRPASHGCVRLSPKNAGVLFRLVNKHGKERTKIVVHGTQNHGSARVATRERQLRGPQAQVQRRASRNVYAQTGYAPRYAAPRGYYPPRGQRYQPRGLFTPGY